MSEPKELTVKDLKEYLQDIPEDMTVHVMISKYSNHGRGLLMDYLVPLDLCKDYGNIGVVVPAETGGYDEEPYLKIGL